MKLSDVWTVYKLLKWHELQYPEYDGL